MFPGILYLKQYLLWVFQILMYGLKKSFGVVGWNNGRMATIAGYFRQSANIGDHNGYTCGHSFNYTYTKTLAITSGDCNKHVQPAELIRNLFVGNGRVKGHLFGNTEFPCQLLQFCFKRSVSCNFKFESALG